MILNEIFNKSVEWKCRERNHYEHVYDFTIDDKQYVVEFERLIHDEPVYDFTFRRGDRWGKDAYTVNGEGDQFAVFATVKEIFDDFLKVLLNEVSDDDKVLIEIRFEADPRELSRIALYTRMVKQVSKRYPDLEGKAVGHQFKIIHVGHRMNQAKAVGESVEPREKETFRFLGKSWDVSKGYHVVREQNVQAEEFQVSDLASLLGFVRIDKQYAMDAKNDGPVLLAELPQGLMLIDGYHRVYKAKQDGVTTLIGYVLNQEQANAIEL